jgi:hypothetical protein
MPELGDDAAALGMHGIGDFFPGPQLLFAIKTGHIGIALSLVADGRAFADQQTGRGALDVVGLHQRRGYRVGARLRVSGAMAMRLGRRRLPASIGSNNEVMQNSR